MWGLFFAISAATNSAACERALGGDDVARQVCAVPGISLNEARELYHMHHACEALKSAVHASGRTYKWIEIKGNDGFTARCAIED